MVWILPLLGLIGFEAVADIFAKEYSLKGGMVLWFLAIAAYITCNIFWLAAIRNGSGLARGASIFSIASAIIAVGLGVYIFHEKLSSLQTAGVILGFVSLVLIFWE